ncbi:ATP-dependent DNA helicase UvrD/PcrA [hydrothermal vent metagenome]|uniref:DNA 3'-5' helicase n=1 Tax=hydrothermal vent metagenome TaxID=652676 RepID=A0A3B1CCI6_9ZZZZ
MSQTSFFTDSGALNSQPTNDLSHEALKRVLNEQQFEAVIHGEGPLLILAGAGSGKTRVITHRIARLLAEGASPRSIIALTFTNKAAGEMRERIASLSNRMTAGLWVSTFHSACLRILRQHAERINYPKDFIVYDMQDQVRLIKLCLIDIGLEEKKFPARQISSFISRFKNKMKGPEDAAKETRGNDEFIKVFGMYERRLAESRSMDFDDLLLKTLYLLRNEEEVRIGYQERFEHILVDEFQDTNMAQYEIVNHLAGKRRNICAVGDDDQSIYQWRGADITNILNFEKDFPDAKIVLLEKNYRSTGNILRGASEVVSRNVGRKEKKLWTDNIAGEKIKLYTATDEMDEAKYVVDQTKAMRRNDGLSLNDIAVFYRTNSQSRAIEDALRRDGFPYQIFGGLKFYDRKEVKDILAYFKAALNHFDVVSFKRIINTPPRGIGAVTISKLEMAAITEGVSLSAALDNISAIQGLGASAQEKLEKFREVLSTIRSKVTSASPADAINEALTITGYMDWLSADKKSESLSRLENLTELVNAAEEFEERTGENSMMAFLDQSALISEADKVDETTATVKLMTVHISKGLEFPAVFVTGLEDNMFPHARSKGDNAQMEEERRLLYVAMTRAKEKLFLTHALTRRVFGVSQANTPSVFLNDIPQEVLAKSGGGKAVTDFSSQHGRTRTPASTNRPVKLFKNTREQGKEIGGLRVGQKVSHPSFNVGVIRAIEGAGEKSRITIYFPRFGEKKLMRKFAKLTAI